MIKPDLHNRINRDLEERKVIFILCNCEIEYFGRSRSVIGLGHRLVIIKKDSTLLVHSLTGYKPVNWMNAPTETVAEFVGDDLVLQSQRTKKPFEEMKVKIMEVVDYSAYTDVVDNEKLDLTHTEQDMQDYLAKNPKLIHPDFYRASDASWVPGSLRKDRRDIYRGGIESRTGGPPGSTPDKEVQGMDGKLHRKGPGHIDRARNNA
jgi:RecB family endonuclease NucS